MSAFLWRVLLIASVAAGTSVRLNASEGGISRCVILWAERARGSDSVDQQAFEATAGSMGYHTFRVSPARFFAEYVESTVLLIVPHAAAISLSRADAHSLVERVRRGLCLVTDGRSPLSRALGFRLGSPERTSRIRDRLRPRLRLTWPDSPRVPWVRRAAGQGMRAIYVDRETGHPLGMVTRMGLGRCLYLAPLLDGRSGLGYSRFPTLPGAIVETLGHPPLFTRRAAEAYFDPGFRFDTPPDSLAAVWKRWGIRSVYAAAWYAQEDPPYDYGGLIDACHRNAILVYAWLEWPYIGRAFWDKHPEWRQKNALLKDAQFDFLYLMDLQNPACMSRALADLDSLLRLDWDGVDVAEFTLTGAGKQGLEGPARPEWFTGFTDYCREEFMSKEGFDPLDLFSPQSPHYWRTNRQALESFYRYRTMVNVTTQHRLFEELDRINRTRNASWELILTIVDNSLHPEFDDLLGFDAGHAMDLLQEFDVTLQVEDPYMEWTRPPQRYASMGMHYRKLLGNRPFLFDINIVPMKRERGGKFSSVQAVGTEVLQCCVNAIRHTDRVCFYCESSVAEEDWRLIPFALAAGALAAPESTGWVIHAPSTVHAAFAQGERPPLLDDRPWYAFDSSGVLIPAGDHTLRFSRTEDSPDVPHLLAITGELLSARHEGTRCVVEYISRPRCALAFDRRPGSVLIDGAPGPVQVLMDSPTYTILAPPGKHTVAISQD